MPQRFLRPAITNSDRWNSVSWRCQSFYIRIITLVDDYGRHDGRASVLWGQCFSVWNEKHPDDSVNLQQVEQMLQELAAESVRLIELYESEGKKVVQVTQWQERVRDGAKEKWPQNPNPQEYAAVRSKILPSPPPPPPSSSPISILGSRIGMWFNRRPTTCWSAKELKALKAVEDLKTSDEDLDLLETYYKSDAKYKRQDITTLLNNWNGEIDRAKGWKNGNHRQALKPTDRNFGTGQDPKKVGADTAAAIEGD